MRLLFMLCFLRYLFYPAMYWYIQKSWPESCVFWCPSSRGKNMCLLKRNILFAIFIMCPTHQSSLGEFGKTVLSIKHVVKTMCTQTGQKIVQISKPNQQYMKMVSCLVVFDYNIMLSWFSVYKQLSWLYFLLVWMTRFWPKTVWQ